MRKSRFEAPYVLLRLISKTLLGLFFPLTVQGLGHLNGQQSGFILAGNHAGYLDSLILFAACPRYFCFLMTEAVFSWPWVGGLVRYGNIIPLYKGREKRALVEAVQSLREGYPVCIFPEGGLTRTGELAPFNEGVAFLREKSGVPVLPFAIQGGFEAWPYGRRWPRFRKLTLVIGPPLPVRSGVSRADVTRQLEAEVRRLMMFSRSGQALQPSSVPLI